MGALASMVGWKAKGLVEKLEEKRKDRAADWFKTKTDKQEKREKIASDLAKGAQKSVFDSLTALGY